MKPITLEEEFKKCPELKKEDIKLLKEWAAKQPHFPPISDEMLALFLNSCHYRLEATKTVLDTYLTVRTHVPEFFDNRDPFTADIKNGKPVVSFFMIPGTTPNGSRVIFVKVTNTDTSDFSLSNACKTFIMTADMEHYFNGTSKGFLILFDMNGVAFGHLAKLYILTIKKILYYLQEAMPVRLTGLHFINVVPFMDKILALMRPFLRKDLMDNMHLHTQGIDSLYKFVPKSLLPEEYGGDSGPFDKLHEASLKLRQENKKFFEEEKKMRVDETKRPGKAKDAGEIFGVEGSFKKLNLD